MAKFTIETTYRLPVFRQHAYEADTLEAACRLAVEDDDWSDQKDDYDSSDETYVTGIWQDDVPPYRAPGQVIPSHFSEAVQCRSEHFEVLLGLLKVFAHAPKGEPADAPFWRQRADAAIVKAEAILANARDPD